MAISRGSGDFNNDGNDDSNDDGNHDDNADAKAHLDVCNRNCSGMH